jgi:hypothetical protein
VTVERRGAGDDLLHRIVREDLPELREALAERGQSLPAYVLSELERFSACGDLTEGFA